MGTITVQDITTSGLDPTYAAATAGGDDALNNGRSFIHVLNANVGATRTVTIDSQVNCNQGFDHNVAVTVPTSGEQMVGPFPPDRFNDSNNEIQITYDTEADLTIAVLSLGAS